MKELLNIKSLHTKIIFLFSGIVMTILLHTGGIKSLIAGVLFSFLIWCFLLFRYKILEKILDKISKKLIIASIVFSIVSVCYWWFSSRYYRHFNDLDNFIMEKARYYIEIPLLFGKILSILIKIGVIAFVPMAFFVVCLFYYFFLGFLYKLGYHLVTTLEKIEKRYIVITSTIIAILIVVIFSISTIFYGPTINGNKISNDVVYTLDSPALIDTNVYANIAAPENDIRQPLFGVFALPFGITSLIFSKLLFFLPDSYAMIITIVQSILLQICIILLGRIIGLRGIKSIAFYLLMMFSYPCLLFSLAPEQYIFSILWLILLLYLYHIKFYDNIESGYTILYIAATGSLLTTGILFPYISNRKGWELIKVIGITGIIFIFTLVIFGQTDVLWHSISSIKNLMRFAGGAISFGNRLLQYCNFVSLCFVKSPVYFDNTNGYVTYQLAPITALNSLGLVLLVFVMVSFILNRNNKFARVCIFWIAYSFIILCIIGWGTMENGLILYTLYFGWAFVCLIFMGIERIMNRLPIIKYFIYVCFVLFLVCVNIPAIYDIIRFGIMYYPVTR
ncbi:MAG: hypothetical protein LBB89_08930 [Treponema sp.]|jgi:hypothetical protein|nr:hypothetical protein [Treponema sp.]